MAQAAPSESAEQLRDAFLQFSGGVADRNDRYKVNCPMNSYAIPRAADLWKVSPQLVRRHAQSLRLKRNA
jgi:hypothetical protein